VATLGGGAAAVGGGGVPMSLEGGARQGRLGGRGAAEGVIAKRCGSDGDWRAGMCKITHLSL
jgi:hypothetical protein